MPGATGHIDHRHRHDGGPADGWHWRHWAGMRHHQPLRPQQRSGHPGRQPTAMATQGAHRQKSTSVATSVLALRQRRDAACAERLPCQPLVRTAPHNHKPCRNRTRPCGSASHCRTPGKAARPARRWQRVCCPAAARAHPSRAAGSRARRLGVVEQLAQFHADPAPIDHAHVQREQPHEAVERTRVPARERHRAGARDEGALWACSAGVAGTRPATVDHKDSAQRLD